MNRRGFLASILAAGGAPYVSTMAGVLMPVHARDGVCLTSISHPYVAVQPYLIDPDERYIRNGDLNEAALEDVVWQQLADNMRRTKEIAHLHAMTFIEPTHVIFGRGA